MGDAKSLARLAGLFLLGAVAGLIAFLSVLPSFDARPEFFPEWFPGLVEVRARYGIALGLIFITGMLAIFAGMAFSAAFRRAESSGAVTGYLFIAAGGGFILSLIVVAFAIIQASGLSWRGVLTLGLAPFAPLAVFLALPGEDPIIWLSVGLPSLVWSVVLGGYLAATGRVAR
jgi:hypothetical protein